MGHSSNKIVSCIIIYGGRQQYLRACLYSLVVQSTRPDEVIVIDNARDASAQAIVSEVLPSARVLATVEMLSYSQGVNCGIAATSGEFVLCLNDDVVLDAGFIANALAGFRKDGNIGMVSGKVLRSDRKTIDSAGLFVTPWRTAGERGYGRTDTGTFEKEEFIFAVTGAVAFYRRKTLEAIRQGDEYYDASFYHFYDDLDAGWRAQACGWKAYYIPSAVAYHVRGGTLRGSAGIDKPYARLYLNDTLYASVIVNRYRTLIKNETLGGLCRHLHYILAYEVVQWVMLAVWRPALLIRLFFLPEDLAAVWRKRLSCLRKIV